MSLHNTSLGCGIHLRRTCGNMGSKAIRHSQKKNTKIRSNSGTVCTAFCRSLGKYFGKRTNLNLFYSQILSIPALRQWFVLICTILKNIKCPLGIEESQRKQNDCGAQQTNYQTLLQTANWENVLEDGTGSFGEIMLTYKLN